MSIEVQNITKTFGGKFTALRDVSLTVQPGELLALLGPSGSGKTTLLRIIAGLEFADPGSGRVLFDGQDVTGVPAGARQVGFAFQHYALFRHMTVFENIAFGLRVRPKATRPAEGEIAERVRKLLALVQLGQFERRYPSQLSGGQRQRVALARALAVEPKVLLLDEPFGALDAKVRKELRRWLRNLHQEIHLTTVFVTHDQDEALEVADRVVVMNQARIEQIGTPEEVYDHPATPFVYNFLGQVNLFHGRLRDGGVDLGGGTLPAPDLAGRTHGEAVAFVRPHDIRLHREPRGESTLPARVRRIHAAGPIAQIELDRPDGGPSFTVQISRERQRELALQTGETVHVELDQVRVFPEDFSI
jgi:sulfate transport system ATP-binding protein